MKLINDQLYLEFSEMVEAGVSETYLKKAKSTGTKCWEFINDPDDRRRVLIGYERLRDQYKEMVQVRWGNPYDHVIRQPILEGVVTRTEAMEFFASYTYGETGRLPEDTVKKCVRADAWLTFIGGLSIQDIRKGYGMVSVVDFYAHCGYLIKLEIKNGASTSYKGPRQLFGNFPASYKRLMEKAKGYEAAGMESLIPETVKRMPSRKVTPEMESLFVSLYVRRKGRTTALEVYKDYTDFMAGKLTAINLETGEAYTPDTFRGVHISPSTVYNYLNMSHNRKLADKLKLSAHDYTQKHMPHNRRKGPKYSFSLVSMDDYLLPFKTADGKRSVWMYVIFDAASKAIVGASYKAIRPGEDGKNVDLVNEALRDMLRLCIRKGWGLPLELEMERHLNYQRRGSEEAPDIFTEGHVFRYIRFAKGNNSQEKLAERLLGGFKYQELVKEDGFLGRPHGRNENYRYNKDTPEGRYQQTDLIRRVRAYVEAWNISPHPDHPEMTKWEYLERNINREAINWPVWRMMPYVGYRTKTSIRRGDCQVQGKFYACKTDSRVNASNGVVDVEAYWIPDENKEISKVYLFQNGKYVGEGDLIEEYQYARAERTHRDWEVFGKQYSRQRKFEKVLRGQVDDLQQVDMVGSEQSTPVDTELQYVRVGYDKLAEETEALNEVNGDTDDDKPFDPGVFAPEMTYKDYLNDL